MRPRMSSSHFFTLHSSLFSLPEGIVSCEHLQEQFMPTPSSGDTHLPSSTVLVVDDNAQNVELMQAYLESLNCTVHVAIDGVDALEKVPKINPDLILLDIMMPRMSGFEVCRRLKADPKTR